MIKRDSSSLIIAISDCRFVWLTTRAYRDDCWSKQLFHKSYLIETIADEGYTLSFRCDSCFITIRCSNVSWHLEYFVDLIVIRILLSDRECERMYRISDQMWDSNNEKKVAKHRIVFINNTCISWIYVRNVFIMLALNFDYIFSKQSTLISQ